MNNKIIELAVQAGYHPDVYEMCKPGLEKFAELIVKECAEVAIEHTDFWGKDVAQEITEHFGVK